MAANHRESSHLFGFLHSKEAHNPIQVEFLCELQVFCNNVSYNLSLFLTIVIKNHVIEIINFSNRTHPSMFIVLYLHLPEKRDPHKEGWFEY